MGDMREDYDAMRENRQAQRSQRYSENLTYLEEHNVAWTWVDELSDHILINGEIDYYLANTHWSHRKTKKRGYAMLSKLLTKE